jgi:hypothetical protein
MSKVVDGITHDYEGEDDEELINKLLQDLRDDKEDRN